MLAFGLPGRGKTHVVSAIGHELVQRGYEVLFVPAVLLVQRLLVQRLLMAKKNQLLEKKPSLPPGPLIHSPVHGTGCDRPR